MGILRQYWERIFSRLKKPSAADGRHATGSQAIERELLNSRFEATREADSRKILELDQRLAGIEAERNQARDQVRILEDSLAETRARLERTDGQISALQAVSVEQARQFTASLAAASNRLEAADNQVSELASRLERERELGYRKHNPRIS